MLNRRYFFCFVWAVSLIKIVLVAGNEIVAVPYDSADYVRQAANHLYGLGAAPGYPFWLALSGLSGVPQRISIEILLLLSSFVLSCWLRKMFGFLCAALAFFMLVMSPATYFIFDYALSDGFYACLSIVAISFSGILVFSSAFKARLAAALGLGTTMGWMALSRNEDPFLFAWVGLVLVFSIFRSFWINAGAARLSLLGAAAVTAAAIALPAVSMIEVVNLVHLKESGVAARTLAGLPGHTRLLRNLAEIDTGEVSISHVPITAKARSLAYMASPTLRKYENTVEARDSIFQQVSREAGLTSGEIGAGWIWHVFNVAVLQGNGVVGAESEYRKINAELDDAFRSERLKKKFILHAFATAPPMEIISRLPLSFWNVAKKSFQTYPQGSDLGYEKQVFDAVALRRSDLIGGGYKNVIQGWAFVENGNKKITSVMFAGDVDANSVDVSYMPRTDVENAFRKPDGSKPAVLGFRLNFYTSSAKPGKLIYFMEDGAVLMGGNMSAGATEFESEVGGGTKVQQGIDVATVGPFKRLGYRHDAQAYLSKVANAPFVSSALTVILLVLCVLPIVAGKYFHSMKLDARLFICMVASLFVFRVLFYAVLESEAWVVEVRYMLAANFMAAILAAVAGAFILNAVGRFFGGSSSVGGAQQ